MKTCPVCNESFEDDLKFCDLDGTRLTRAGVSSLRDPNRLWSILGVGLLLGALLISAITVFYLPRASISTLETPTGSEAVSNPGATEAASTANEQSPQGTLVEPQVIAEAAPPDAAKEKAAAPVTETSPDSADTAKSAGTDGTDGETAKTAPKTEEPPAAVAEPKNTTPTIKTVGDTKSSEAASKPAQPAAESKKDAKSDPSKAKTQEKDSDKKKKDDEKKKKGGFFGVFKKIFGKKG
ncbi:MAG: hypothetical protein L0229_09665 [Blastocatellia bacterium]|nr:hypothetical protein [Blastocatellia bacterium]